MMIIHYSNNIKNSLVYHDTCIRAECWMNLWQMSNWGNKGISIAENARRQIDIIHNNTEQWRTQHALYINEKQSVFYHTQHCKWCKITRWHHSSLLLLYSNIKVGPGSNFLNVPDAAVMAIHWNKVFVQLLSRVLNTPSLFLIRHLLFHNRFWENLLHLGIINIYIFEIILSDAAVPIM